MTRCMSEALPVQVDSILLSKHDVFLLMCKTEGPVAVRGDVISTTLSVAVHVPILEASTESTKYFSP